MAEFTPFPGLIGGLFIGCSVTLLLFFNGEMTGLSGFFARILKPCEQSLEPFLFLLGMGLGVFLFRLFDGFRSTIILDAPVWAVVTGGLLVGFGTRLGSGCTSGHGICGIARCSRRSLVATFLFMGFGILTVYVIRRVTGGWF